MAQLVICELVVTKVDFRPNVRTLTLPGQRNPTKGGTLCVGNRWTRETIMPTETNTCEVQAAPPRAAFGSGSSVGRAVEWPLVACPRVAGSIPAHSPGGNVATALSIVQECNGVEDSGL